MPRERLGIIQNNVKTTLNNREKKNIYSTSDDAIISGVFKASHKKIFSKIDKGLFKMRDTASITIVGNFVHFALFTNNALTSTSSH